MTTNKYSGIFEGIVFDFDGVIVDSESRWVDIETPYLVKHIHNWKAENYSELIGRSLNDVFDYIKGNYNFSVTKEQYFKDYEKMALKLYKKIAICNADMADLLLNLRNNEAKMAIATSSKSSWVRMSLENNKILEYINTIISADDNDIEHGKPAPDVYLKAASILKTQPKNLVAVEDSSSGIKAAKAAGLYCIGLRNGANDGQNMDEADEIVNGYKRLKENLMCKLYAKL